jgi:hypothetical protein
MPSPEPEGEHEAAGISRCVGDYRGWLAIPDHPNEFRSIQSCNNLSELTPRQLLSAKRVCASGAPTACSETQQI